jgi:hypothetical protein
MNNSLLKFHHFGLAVRHPGAARIFLTSLGYRIGETVFDPEQNVHLALCWHNEDPAVEIIWPGTGPGPIDALTQLHSSGIVYHVCYETSNLAGVLSDFKAAALRVVRISSPKPAKLFGGRKVSFYNIVGIGLIELLEPMNDLETIG